MAFRRRGRAVSRVRHARGNWTRKNGSKFRVGRRRVHSRRFTPSLGQPARKYVQLPYVERLDYGSAGAGAVQYNQFRANSIFDPDLTGIGHQPMAHDQWGQFYNRYQVISCIMTATFLPVYGQLATTDLLSAGTGANPAIIGIKLTDTAGDIGFTSTGDLSTGLENRFIKWKAVVGEAGQATRPHTIKYKVKISKFLGRNWDDDTLGAAFGANPAAEMFLVPFVQPAQTSTTSANWVVVVKIKYNVMLSKPQTLVGS